LARGLAKVYADSLETRKTMTLEFLLSHRYLQREIFIDNLLVRVHFLIMMIRLTGLAPWGV